MLQDPAVLTASKWQDWLHPRGKDGQFIVKDTWVNVFGDGPGAAQRPARPAPPRQDHRLTPQGAYVTYFDATPARQPQDPGRRGGGLPRSDPGRRAGQEGQHRRRSRSRTWTSHR
jgi:hypothetical protein